MAWSLAILAGLAGSRAPDMHQNQCNTFDLPRLRRYARALTGDVQLARLLTQCAVDPCRHEREQASVLDAYRAIGELWRSRFSQLGSKQVSSRNPEQMRIASMQPAGREAFLLTSLEGFQISEAAGILSTSTDKVRELVKSALEDVKEVAPSKVLIIEDEFFIARDLERIVCDLGHAVVGKARTMSDAVQAFESCQPDLVLSDIAIAGDGDGIAAVLSMIQRSGTGQLPAVFISAFPERLVSEKRPQPTFIVGKPFTDEAVRSAVTQLLFFNAGSYQSCVASPPVSFGLERSTSAVRVAAEHV